MQRSEDDGRDELGGFGARVAAYDSRCGECSCRVFDSVKQGVLKKMKIKCKYHLLKLNGTYS